MSTHRICFYIENQKKKCILIRWLFYFFFSSYQVILKKKNMTTKCSNKVEYCMQNPRSDHLAHLHSLITVTDLL